MKTPLVILHKVVVVIMVIMVIVVIMVILGDPAQGDHGDQEAEGSDVYDCLGGGALSFDKNELQFSQSLPVDERCLSNSSIPSENNLKQYKRIR